MTGPSHGTASLLSYRLAIFHLFLGSSSYLIASLCPCFARSVTAEVVFDFAHQESLTITLLFVTQYGGLRSNIVATLPSFSLSTISGQSYKAISSLSFWAPSLTFWRGGKNFFLCSSWFLDEATSPFPVIKDLHRKTSLVTQMPPVYKGEMQENWGNPCDGHLKYPLG